MKVKCFLFTVVLLSCLSTTAQDTSKIDSSIAYVRYNPEVKKYAVWARSHKEGWHVDSSRWDFLNWSDLRGFYLRLHGQPQAPFLMFDKKEDAEDIAKKYVPVWFDRMGFKNRRRPDDFERLAKGFQ